MAIVQLRALRQSCQQRGVAAARQAGPPLADALADPRRHPGPHGDVGRAAESRWIGPPLDQDRAGAAAVDSGHGLQQPDPLPVRREAHLQPVVHLRGERVGRVVLTPLATQLPHLARVQPSLQHLRQQLALAPPVAARGSEDAGLRTAIRQTHEDLAVVAAEDHGQRPVQPQAVVVERRLDAVAVAAALAHLAEWRYACDSGNHYIQCLIAVEDCPRNQHEFEARLASEQACQEYLALLRWPVRFRCPQCGCIRSEVPELESSPILHCRIRVRQAPSRSPQRIQLFQSIQNWDLPLVP